MTSRCLLPSLLAGDTVLLHAQVTIFNSGELDTITLRKGHPRLALMTNDEDVGETGGEVVTSGITDVNDLEVAGVTLTVGDNTNTTNVITTGHHDGGADLEPDGQ